MAVSIQMKSFPPAAGFFSWLIWGQLEDLGLAFTASPPVPWPWEGMIGGGPSTVQDGEQSRRNSCGLIKGWKKCSPWRGNESFTY